MTDHLTRKKRSWNMSRIRSKDTIPERKVRSVLFKMGCRFSLHRTDLPGKPDIVLPKYNAVIFVHGCFWHHHRGCKEASNPKTNSLFWKSKLMNNIMRDKRNKKQLKKLGWKVKTIWECESEKVSVLQDKLRAFISP